MSLLNVVDRVSSHEPRPFIAPIPSAESVDVFVHQDNIPYRFKMHDPEPGWWLLNPNGNRVGVGRRAYPHEYLQYLDLLPRFYAIACFYAGNASWVVVPFNGSDANQRGWQNGQPRLVHLVRESVRPFDVVDTRSLAGTLLYNSVSSIGMEMFEPCMEFIRGDSVHRPKNQDWSNAITLVQERNAEIRRRAAERRRKEAEQALVRQRRTLHDRIKFDVEFVGAELVELVDAGEDLQVTWTYDGYTHTSRINRRGRLESAGICLGDRRDDYDWHNMSTLILAIQEGRGLHRFGIPEEAYL